MDEPPKPPKVGSGLYLVVALVVFGSLGLANGGALRGLGLFCLVLAAVRFFFLIRAVKRAEPHA